MQLESELRSGTLVIKVRQKRIDAAVALQFKESMRRATAEGPARNLLDLHNVEFVDSSGLGAIVGAMKQLSPEKTLELANLTATVAKVFQLTRMDTIFAIHEDVEDALSENEV